MGSFPDLIKHSTCVKKRQKGVIIVFTALLEGYSQAEQDGTKFANTLL